MEVLKRERKKEHLVTSWKVYSKKDARFNLQGQVKGPYAAGKLLNRAIRRLEKLFGIKAPEDLQLTAWEL